MSAKKENEIENENQMDLANLIPKKEFAKKVGNYILTEQIGLGTFSKVTKGIHTLTGEKEEKLNNDITDYINQINDLKNEMEVLNNIITNLTEEKENNAIKITNLIHENEKLKQNIKDNNANNCENNTESSSNNNKKYEEIILKLKKNMLNLKEENLKVIIINIYKKMIIFQIIIFEA